MTHDLIWWEKTVEYTFILAAREERKLDFAAPLSGAQERGWADAVFSSDSKIVLVEFKRSEKELDSEADKYEDYEGAAKELAARDTFHWLVYADLKPDGRGLILKACRYFSREAIDVALNLLDRGVSEDKFRKYLSDLLKFKKRDGRTSGSIGPESIVAAVGIDLQGKCNAIPLAEYCRMAFPDLDFSHTHDDTSNYSSPSPGG